MKLSDVLTNWIVGLILQMCYRILFGTGLVEAFHIPEKELLCYLHALECGYREVPYHNKMHAADVLHAVFYLTTQPVAGLEQTLISDLCIAQEYQRTQPDGKRRAKLLYVACF